MMDEDFDLLGQYSRFHSVGKMLLNGYGYNWYLLDNQMRSDDILVRSEASANLALVINRLHTMEANYRRKHLRPPTRDNPYPDPKDLDAVRDLHAAADQIGELDTRVRGAVVPPNDKVWQRHRNELTTLKRLGECDVILAGAAEELCKYVASLPGDSIIDEQVASELLYHSTAISRTLERRSRILA
jgi:hypothetical protein